MRDCSFKVFISRAMKGFYIVSLLVFVEEFVSVSSNGLKLYLYDSTNIEKPKELDYINIKLINPDVPVKVIVHGWNTTAEVEWYNAIKNEYLLDDDYNVIQVDWSAFSMRDYYSAAKCSSSVGDSLAEILHYIYMQIKLPLDGIHMICHSLGAHVCGQTGRYIKTLTGTKIHRITALDPAGPFFETDRLFQPLGKTDAMIVDVIHTDGGVFGYLKSLGTIDFFPNGGQRPLPECPSIFHKGEDLEKFMWCNHRMSIGYFIKSINNVTFLSIQCGSWSDYVEGVCDHNQRLIMGEDLSYQFEYNGDYYLTTV